MLRDQHFVEARGAAAGQALAETVPVIHARYARRVAADQHIEVGFVVVRTHQDPVGVQRTGRIILFAVQQEVIGAFVRIRRDGDRVARGACALRDGRAEGLALADHAEPVTRIFVILALKQQFSEAGVHAQDLRQIRFRFRQADQQAEKLRQRDAAAAVFDRHAQRCEAGVLEPLHGFVRQFAVVLTVNAAFCDAREDGFKTRQQGVERWRR